MFHPNIVKAKSAKNHLYSVSGKLGGKLKWVDHTFRINFFAKLGGTVRANRT